MTAMSRASRSLRILAATVLVTGCAGPADSGSPGPSSPETSFPDASPTFEPTVASSPTFDPGSTAEPTIEPEPTPVRVAAPRIEIEINRNVVDRPGVPVSLRDKYWWTGSDVGLIGTTAQLGLPRNEHVSYAANGLVVSLRGQNERGTDIYVRDFETGAIVGEVRTSIVVYTARVIDGQLFWAGIRPEKVDCGGSNVDGGVWVMNLDDDRGPVAIVEPGSVTHCGMGARGLGASPSGKTLVSVLGNDHDVDVIDVASLTRTHRLNGFWPDAYTDDVFLQEDSEPSDGQSPGAGMTAYDLDTGIKRWSFPGPDRVEHFGMTRAWAMDSEFFVEYVLLPERPGEFVLATFDPLTGKQRVLLRQHDTQEDDDLAKVEPEMSSSSHLALSFHFRWEAAGPRDFAVLDLQSGEITWNAFTIDPPWLCYFGDCFRDG
jgi:hypothetical protein